MSAAHELARTKLIRRRNVWWLCGLLTVVAVLYAVFMMRAAQF